MAAGSGYIESGEGHGSRSLPEDAERKALEDELLEAESTLVGELNQIESLARENTMKASIFLLPP